MAENVTARTDKDHRTALEQLVEDGHADSLSEALRQTSQRELARMGYLNGTQRDTTLRQFIREAGKLSTYAAIFALGMSLFYPFAFRVPVMILIIGGMVLFGVDAGLARVEPRVSNNIKRFVGVDKA